MNVISVKRLDLDQDRRSVGSDLGPKFETVCKGYQHTTLGRLNCQVHFRSYNKNVLPKNGGTAICKSDCVLKISKEIKQNCALLYTRSMNYCQMTCICRHHNVEYDNLLNQRNQLKYVSRPLITSIKNDSNETDDSRSVKYDKLVELS